ncbi:MAG: hypothetical protein SFY56_10255 [Bacteroidota bacterium]|nr:hypothetical protein [Bacteroidota bacterium]
MTKITLGFSILATVGLLVVGCNKKANVAPEADTEFQSSIDAAYATSLVTEVEDIAGYLGEGYTASNAYFFTNAGTSGSVLYSTPSSDVVAISYVGTVTCMDGKKRSGTVTVDYNGSSLPLGAKFYRDPGFVGKVSLSNYVVDGWAFNSNNSSFTITNTTPSGFDAKTVPLTWSIKGNAYMTLSSGTVNAVDSMSWSSTLTKTLSNSTNSFVMNPNKLTAIKFVAYTPTLTAPPLAAAKCLYSGTVTGVISKNKAYTYAIKEGEDVLVRDFGCAPDRYVVVPTSTTIATYISEWHPISQGVVNYSVSGATDPRVINYGKGECDNNGSVTIKGISYPIDFKK